MIINYKLNDDMVTKQMIFTLSMHSIRMTCVISADAPISENDRHTNCHNATDVRIRVVVRGLVDACERRSLPRTRIFQSCVS